MRKTEEEVGGQRQRVDRPGLLRDSWFQGHRWCPNDTTGYRVDDDDDNGGIPCRT